VGERCQLDDSLYRLDFPYSYARLAKRAVVRTRDRLRGRAPLGEASRFREGDWVRVKSAEEIRATLDANDKLRGLLFMEAQWGYCGGTYEVDRVLRRLLDRGRRFRTIARTVALDGVTCDGLDGTSGCGRACSLYFRDEWLETSSEDRHVVPAPTWFARVRPWAEITATLDRHGRRDGVSVMAEMERFAGQRFPVLRRVEDIDFDPAAYMSPAAELFTLGGVRCSGAAFVRQGPCHRNCGIVWHRDWLELEERGVSDDGTSGPGRADRPRAETAAA
jgi:hypothetical protein